MPYVRYSIQPERSAKQHDADTRKMVLGQAGWCWHMRGGMQSGMQGGGMQGGMQESGARTRALEWNLTS
jgi:hypothetical protein